MYTSVRLELLPKIKDDILPLYYNFLRSEISPMVQLTSSHVLDKACRLIISNIYSWCQFKTFISTLLTDCKEKSKYINLLTDSTSMPLYASAFTHKSIDLISNYERFEILGDITCNKFLVWYFSRRFPKLFSTAGVKIIAELRIKYGSKIVFAHIALERGFMPYISDTKGEFDLSVTLIREDVEAQSVQNYR